jgi:hypothetical protein
LVRGATEIEAIVLELVALLTQDDARHALPDVIVDDALHDFRLLIVSELTLGELGAVLVNDAGHTFVVVVHVEVLAAVTPRALEAGGLQFGKFPELIETVVSVTQVAQI